MADITVPYPVSVVKENGLQFVEREGQILFSSEEIGRQLGYRQPLKSVNVLWNRNQKELEGYATGIKLISADGCMRETRCFTEEGVYILSMLANTPRAAVFRAQLARLLRDLREQRLDQAREAGYRQGREETLALPAVKKERQAGYLAGMKEGEKLQKRRDGLRQLMRIRAYREKGLTQAEIGRILGISRDAVKRRMMRAREMGVAI